MFKMRGALFIVFVCLCEGDDIDGAEERMGLYTFVQMSMPCQPASLSNL